MQTDIVIIGGGISGLSMAWYCQQAGLKTVLLEQAVRVGGIFDSRQQSSHSGDFWVELGTHSCFNSYQQLLDIMEACQALAHITPKHVSTFRFWQQQRLHSLPSQLHWFELITHLPRVLWQDKQGQTVGSYYRQIFGPRNYQDVLQHAFNAVICQPAEQFPADLLFRKRKRRKDVLKNFTFPQGIQQLAELLATCLQQRGVLIKTASTVQQIQFAQGQFQVQTEAGEHWQSRLLTLATPVSAAVSLLQTTWPQLAALLAQIEVASVSSVGMVMPKTALTLEPLAGIIAADAPFYSIVGRDYLPDANYRGFTAHFKPDALPVAAQIALMRQVLGVAADQVLWTAQKMNTLPALKQDHAQLIQQIDHLLDPLPLGLTGNYFAGVAVEDCVNRSYQTYQRLMASTG